MFNVPGIISSELRYPTETSKKKKRYITFKCEKCNKVCEKVYQKNRYKPICESCGKGLWTTEEFILVGKKHFGDKYDYSKTVYTGKDTYITITCPIHGDFTQRAQEHAAGHGCIKCAQERRKENQLLPKEVWLDRIKDYPLISFKDPNQIKNYHGIVELVCKLHGKFKVQLGQVGSAKHICKHCSYVTHQIQSVRPEYIGKDAYLYYVYLPDIDMYKFGVTIDKDKRFTQLGTVKLIAEGMKEYSEAIRLEHKVMTDLDQYRYKGRRVLIKNGSTELFKKDVLKQIKRALQE